MLLEDGERESATDAGAALAYSAEEESVARQLMAENYAELLTIARGKRRRAGLGNTLLTTDLLHESYLKLHGERRWRSGEHFVRAAVLAMRHVIVDYVRSKHAQKRGGGEVNVPLDEAERALPEFSETQEELLGIAELLEELARTQPRWVRIIDARYFGGMTEAETATLLSLSDRTVRRDWTAARNWLAARLGATGC